MAAGPAHAEMDPPAPHLQAFLAALGAGRYVPHLIQMGAGRRGAQRGASPGDTQRVFLRPLRRTVAGIAVPIRSSSRRRCRSSIPPTDYPAISTTEYPSR